MSKRDSGRIALFAVSVAILTLAVLPCQAWAADGLTVDLLPQASQINPAEAVLVDIYISNPAQIGVRSWTIDLAFDPAVLDATAFAPGPYITGVSATQNLDLDNDGVNPDQARIGVLNFTTTTGDALTGYLGTVTFTGIAAGTSPVSILTSGNSQTALLDAASAEISGITYSDTSIEVLPEPATMLLLAGGGLALIRRRKR